MNEWKNLTKLAFDTKRLMVITKDVHVFESLLQKHPTDGMVHYFFGEGLAELGHKKEAAAEFRLAKSLFPKQEWKDKCDTALQYLRTNDERVIF